METTATTPKWKMIRLVYLYLVSLIGLVVLLVGGIGLLNTGIKALLGVDSDYYGMSVKQVCRDPSYFSYATSAAPVAKPVSTTGEVTTPKPVDVNSTEYKECVKDQEDQQKKTQDNERKRGIAEGLAEIILGTPIWLYHWMVIQRDNKNHTA